jgi:hypothetical protein
MPDFGEVSLAVDILVLFISAKMQLLRTHITLTIYEHSGLAVKTLFSGAEI